MRHARATLQRVPAIAKQTVAVGGVFVVLLGSGIAALSVLGAGNAAYLAHTSIGHAVVDTASPSVATADTAVDSSGADLAGLNLAGFHSPTIEQWVHKLTTSFKGDVEKSLGRMTLYDKMISSKLAARQMPHDLIYLAAIESNFVPTAKSHASAVGMWQFMSATARRFGLKVGHGVDERKNPAAETDAALDYLDQLHDRFGSWYLAAAAYNSGEGAVTRALERVLGKKTGSDADFFKIAPALPKETRDYVPKLIATARIGNDPAAYGVTPAPVATLAAAHPASTTPTPSARHGTRRATHGTTHHTVHHTSHRKKRR